MIAQVEVKIITESGKYALSEINGLKEETYIKGELDDRSNIFRFKWNDKDAILSVGDNCILVATMDIVYIVGKSPKFHKDEMFLSDEIKEAKKYQSENGGYLYYSAEWCEPKEGNIIYSACGKTEKGAIKKSLKYFD